MDNNITTPSTEVVANNSSLVGQASAVAREQAEMQAAMILARNTPRNEPDIFVRVSKGFSRLGMAEKTHYKYKRGKGEIEGTTVKAARELARLWGNIRSGIRIVKISNETVHIKGFAMDMETNAYIELEDEFRKLVQRKAGKETIWIEPDERDLRELINARGARLVRNAILQILPPDLIDEARKTAYSTLKKAAAGELEKDKAEVVRKIAKGFDLIGVTVPMLERYLGHSLDIMTPDEYADLKEIYNSIKEGETQRSDHFEMGSGVASSVESVADRVKSKADAAKAKLGTNEGATSSTPMPD